MALPPSAVSAMTSRPPDPRPVSPALDAQIADWQVVRQLGHDLNNLLGAIVGYTEMLVEDTPPDAPQARDLKRIHESAQRATAIVSALMLHARQAQGQQPR
jgi:signal transduction histidine kinase